MKSIKDKNVLSGVSGGLNYRVVTGAVVATGAGLLFLTWANKEVRSLFAMAEAEAFGYHKIEIQEAKTREEEEKKLNS